ncbi:MAG: CAP domain-containing protein [Deltaproteobacteria bacterium]|nr:CAP domain-containing protein [Deltaproteobacteria bacterium]
MRILRSASLALVLLAACGSKNGGRAPAQGPGGSAYGGQPQVETRVIEERMPDGSIRRTTVTTTRRQVEAPPPPARPADPYPPDPIVKYNVDRVNQYRASVGLPPLLYDAAISAFARQGSERLARDHVAHAHFAEHAQGAPGFGSRSAENQGDPRGVPALDPDPARNAMRQVDVMLELMWREGPGGGHYDNIVNPRMRRIGVGIVYVQGRMYMTNDLSD